MTDKEKSPLNWLFDKDNPDEEISKEDLSKAKNFIKEKFNEDRFKIIGKFYKIDRHLINLGMVVCFLFLLFTAHSNNWDLDYFHCPENSNGAIEGQKVMLKNYQIEDVDYGCKNPFYKETWKNEQYLPPGDYGTDPRPILSHAKLVIFLIMISVVVFNHLFHNRGKINWH